MSIEKLSCERRVKWRTTLRARSTSGRRGGCARPSASGTSGTGSPGSGTVASPASRLRALEDQLHVSATFGRARVRQHLGQAARCPRPCASRSARPGWRRPGPRSRGRCDSRDARRGALAAAITSPAGRPVRTQNSCDVGWSKAERQAQLLRRARPAPSTARPTSRSPCGPSHDSVTSPPSASSVWLVQMFDVAFSRRMCCSRVCRVSTNARSPWRSTVSPDDPARHLADVVHARREEAVVRPTVAQTSCPTLCPSPMAIVAAVRTWRLEHAQRHRVDVGDGQRAGVVGRRGERRRVLQHAEEVRAGRTATQAAPSAAAPQLLGIGAAVAVRHLDDLQARTRGRTSAPRPAPAG